VCDSPDQAAHYRTLGTKLGASSLTRHLAGLGVKVLQCILSNLVNELYHKTNISSAVLYPPNNVSSKRQLTKSLSYFVVITPFLKLSKNKEEMKAMSS
jgi:hypothetical protein